MHAIRSHPPAAINTVKNDRLATGSHSRKVMRVMLECERLGGVCVVVRAVERARRSRIGRLRDEDGEGREGAVGGGMPCGRIK